MFSKMLTPSSTDTFSAQIERLRQTLGDADAVLIGAGAGLSASAGLAYDGPRFEERFADFIEKYHMADLYSGGFYPFESEEERWAWWSRHIYWNRYVDAPRPVYQELLALVKGKDHFVLTTNVDHQFQRAGFDTRRLFCTQGDYGLLQCSEPCCQKTYDNETLVRQMLERQTGMRVPSELVPRCPVCGKPMSMNLRADDTFVEDEDWHTAARHYDEFIRHHRGQRILFFELGVGGNTPVIIKYPFWRMTRENPKAVYACINFNEAFAPAELEHQAICIDSDIGDVLRLLK